MYIKILMVFFLLSPTVLFAQAELSEAELLDLLEVKIRFAKHIAYNPTVVRAVEAQNARRLPLDTIKKNDQAWVDAKGKTTSLMRDVTTNDIAKYLRRRIENNSAIVEAFVTDNQGANVAAYPATSDYWQGDEEKWTASFNNGDGKLFLGPLELDSSTNKTLIQISTPVKQGADTIGVLILGVSVDYLSAK